MTEKLLNSNLLTVYPRTPADVSAEQNAEVAAAANAWELYARGNLKYDPDKK
jgi:hypothetical protein